MFSTVFCGILAIFTRARMPDKKGKCVRCGKGKNRRLNAEGVCFYECLRDSVGDNGGNKRRCVDKQNGRDGKSGEHPKDTCCGKCRRIVQDDIESMQCEACFVWFHLSPCCNIDPVKYRALEDNDLLSVIRWFCRRCDKGIIQFASDLADIKDRLTALENRTDVKAVVMEVVKDHFQEEFEIEKRKLNVIIHGLPEPALETDDADGDVRSTTAQERKEADVSKLVSIGNGNHDINVSANDIDGAFRLGARSEGKTRPMCLKLRNIEARTTLLTKAHLLKNSTTAWHRKVFINPDLTPAQRQKDRAAREELNRRKKSGEQNLIIRNFKVVKDRRPAHRDQQNARREVA